MYRDATETGSIEFSAGAVEARLVPLTFPPLPPSSPALRERKGGRRESMLALPHAITARVQYVPNKKSGFLITR